MSFDHLRIEGYELLEEIHRGGQGAVFRAVQLGTKRPVALKLLLEGPLAGEDARRRFEREVELAASLRHPSIVTILESGVAQGCYFFAMEFIQGERLDAYLARTQPSLDRVVQLFEQIAEAVSFAHLRGVIHRDLKPSNILVDAEGRPHILDFGLAKTAGRADPQQSTVQVLSATGQVLGTLAYMSPEQAAGAQDVDVRSDVYSIGVMMYEALLERPPYPLTGPLAEVLSRIARSEPVPPRSLRTQARLGRQIDDELETILLKALEKDPARRYQNAGELARDLARYRLGEPIEAKRASGLYVLRKTLQRYRLQAAAAGTILAMLVIFLIVFAWLYTNEKTARHQAAQAMRAESAARLLSEQATRNERLARQEAERSSQRATAAAEELREALVRQKLQRGDLARAQGDLAEARDSYWDAYDDGVAPAATLWALRQYYQETGEADSHLLYFRRAGPVTLSPNGRLAAVCEVRDAIIVRDVESGATLAWRPVPDQPTAISLDDDGRLAAAGPGWARLWTAGPLRPLAAVQVRHVRSQVPGSPWLAFEEQTRRASSPVAVHATSDNRWLLVVDPEEVRVYRVSDGELSSRTELAGTLSGTPTFSTTLNLLAVPTSRGVMLAGLDDQGHLQADWIWSRSGQTPRAVRFAADELLAVLSDVIEITQVSGPDRGRWMRFLETGPGWDYFDLKRGVGAIALGRRGGTVALYRGTALERQWSITQGTLEGLRVAEDGSAVYTLDDRGSVTRWVDPAANQQRRTLLNSPVHTWTLSSDGSTLLTLDVGGNLNLYCPQRSPAPVALQPGPLRPLLRRVRDDLELSLSGDGQVLAVRHENRLLLRGPQEAEFLPLRWMQRREPLLRGVALSADGTLLACYAQSLAGDEQTIYFFERPSRRVRPGRSVTDALVRARRPVSLIGSAVRSIAFVPQSERLVVARSNGSLFLIEPQPPDPGPPRHVPGDVDDRLTLSEPWAWLDAPVSLVTFNRDGTLLAAACEDGSLHLLPLVDPSAVRRILVGQRISSLSFNAAGDVLLVRTVDGTVMLYQAPSLERVTRWTLPGGVERPLASWVGPDDAILLSDRDGLHEMRYARVGEAIERNRGYAHQRQIARLLGEGRFDAARAEAAALRGRNATLGRNAQESILDIVLRRPGGGPGGRWLSDVLRDADGWSRLRLGHAAYEGGRFELAAELLEAAQSASAGELDVHSQMRLAECAYLAGRPEQAAEMLEALVARRDFDPRDRVRALLTALASRYLAGQALEAHRLLMRIDEPELAAGLPDAAGVVAAQLIGRYVLGGEERETQLTAGFKVFLSLYTDQSLLYRDDMEFFAGERARHEGRFEEARIRYQRCIDSARDDWPAPWARYRLQQLPEG